MRSLTLALVILAGTVAVPGQLSQGSVLDVKIGPVTTITKGQFDAAVMRMKYPPSEWRGKGARIIFRYKDDQEKPSGLEQANDNKEVFEYDAAGSAREYWELGPWARPASGERVFIADEVFSRVDGGSWTRTADKAARKNVCKMFLADTDSM